jgi:anthraniloyl-CoA monooxygenase
MKTGVVGGGPAGLYAALLLKKAFPDDRVCVFERNAPDDSFGFGIVLSDETLTNLRVADEPTYRAIRASFAYWDDLYTHFKGTVTRSTGHGFSGLERLTLLRILRERALELGVEVEHRREVTDLDGLRRDFDLVVASDGANSAIRERLAAFVRPSVELRPNKFVWLGSTLPLPGFTYVFVENGCGIWNVHSYQYKPGASTIVVETTAETFERAGLADATEAQTIAYLEELLKDTLAGHRLIANRSVWRHFPNVRCARWHHENVVLLGDAAHTAHFSIGSGTKLAMEDAIALANAVARRRGDLPGALAAYEAERREEVEKTQHAADVSLAWFEHVRRVWQMDPVPFNFSLLSRSKQITWENLRLRDPRLVDGVEAWFAREVARQERIAAPARPRAPMFQPLSLRGMTLANRVVVSPMCQYSARDGTPGDWHLMHLGARAVGGAGLIVTEMTCVARDARISRGCAGLYKPTHARAWRRIVRFVHEHSAAKICLQLGHAGRKGSTQLGWEEMDRPLKRGNWPLVSASPIPFYPDSQVPREMSRDDMDRVRDAFVAAARLGDACGFDMLELHLAHGYLLASFISPVTNRRRDEYGGDLRSRMRYPLEVFDAVRAVWPADKPMSARISATDWIEDEGLTGDDAVEIARLLKAHGCDLIDVSTGQTAPESKPVYGRMYQTPFSEQIRLEVGMPTLAVGAITTADQVNTLLAAGRADLCALARPHLADPHFTLNAAAEYGLDDFPWPAPYLSGKSQLEAQVRKARAEANARDERLRALQRLAEADERAR